MCDDLLLLEHCLRKRLRLDLRYLLLRVLLWLLAVISVVEVELEEVPSSFCFYVYEKNVFEYGEENDDILTALIFTFKELFSPE